MQSYIGPNHWEITPWLTNLGLNYFSPRNCQCQIFENARPRFHINEHRKSERRQKLWNLKLNCFSKFEKLLKWKYASQVTWHFHLTAWNFYCLKNLLQFLNWVFKFKIVRNRQIHISRPNTWSIESKIVKCLLFHGTHSDISSMKH